jgi:hypothetical protein
MRDRLSLKYSFELILALSAVAGMLAVLQTFVIGRHYIIPSVILVVVVLLGNLAWYGFQNRLWAKYILFWAGVLFTSHAFFALFWSRRYREILGGSFEAVCGVVVLVFAYLAWQYARRNSLFHN